MAVKLMMVGCQSESSVIDCLPLNVLPSPPPNLSLSVAIPTFSPPQATFIVALSSFSPFLMLLLWILSPSPLIDCYSPFLHSGSPNCISHIQYILNEFLPLPLFVAMRPPLFLFPVPPFSLPRLMLDDKKPDKQRTDDG